MLLRRMEIILFRHPHLDKGKKTHFNLLLAYILPNQKKIGSNLKI